MSQHYGPRTGAEIPNYAEVIFGINPNLTNTVRNVIDAGAPSGAVARLGAEQHSETFSVSWSGVDDAEGLGLPDYTVYVSADDGPYRVCRDRTTLTEAA